MPVYLKAIVGEGVIDYHIAECAPYRGRDNEIACVDTMTVKRRQSLRLPLHLPTTRSAER